MKILVVEDIHVMAVVIQRQLQSLGFREIHIAHSSEEAMRLLHVNQFDLFLVDWVLPGASGIDLIKTLRSTTYYRETPILVTSGNDTLQEVMQAIQAGANDYIVKPVPRDVLKSKLEKLLPALPIDHPEKKSDSAAPAPETAENPEKEAEEAAPTADEAPDKPTAENDHEKKLDGDDPNDAEKSNI